MASGTVERYLLAFNDALVASAERRERILAEVEEHLRDATESLMASGATADGAQSEAVARFGAPQAAAARFGPDPLGRAQEASRGWEARRIAHPVLIPLACWLPFLAYTLWDFGLSVIQIVPSVLLWAQVRRNLQARRAAGFSPGSRVIAQATERVRLAFADRPWIASILGWIASSAWIAWVVLSLDAWFQVVVGYYLVCGMAGYWARVSAPPEPAGQECAERWAVRHASLAGIVRGAAWALALVGPVLLMELVPITESPLMIALLGLAMFLTFSPSPSTFAVQMAAAAQACWTWMICAGVGVRACSG